MAVDVPTQLAIANARIDFFWPLILRLEKFIWSNFGFYVQGLGTHSTIPEDGNMVAPDFPQLTVTDQPFSWGPFLSYFPETMITSMSVILYQYAYSHSGFIARFEMRLNGDLYRKQIAYGPHADHETLDWILMENE